MKITIEITSKNAADNWEVEHLMTEVNALIASGEIGPGESAPLFNSNHERAGWVTLD